MCSVPFIGTSACHVICSKVLLTNVNVIKHSLVVRSSGFGKPEFKSQHDHLTAWKSNLIFAKP